MMDYFGRLLSQTGIRIESDFESQARSAQTPPEAGTENPIALIEIEEQKWIEPDSDKLNQEHGERVRPETEPPAESPTPKPAARPLPDESDAPAWKGFARDAAEDQEHEDQKIKRTESLPSERKVFEPQGSNPSQTDSPSEPLPSLEVTVDRETRVPEENQPPHHSAVQRTPSSGKDASTGGHSGTVHGLSREQIIQSVYKKVRSWVASQPALSTEEQRSHVAEETAEQVEQELQKTADREQAASSRGRRKTGADEAEMSVHDLHLSVGPIHITVEKPENEPPGPKPQPKREVHSPSDGRSSRLSRGYIRI